MVTCKLAKRWTLEEDQILITNHPFAQTTSKWKEISKTLFKGTRNASQCAQRYHRLRHPTKQSIWTESEDNFIRNYVKEFGECKWTNCAQLMMSEHSGKQIRERWREILRPEIKRTQWTQNEDQQILLMWKKIGKKWKQMSQLECLKGRTENQIKNRFNSFVKKYLIDDNENCLTLGSTELIQEEESESQMKLNTESQNFVESLFNEQWNLIEEQGNPLFNFNLTLNTQDDQLLYITNNNSQQMQPLYDQQLSIMSNPKKNVEFDFSQCLEPLENNF